MDFLSFWFLATVIGIVVCPAEARVLSCAAPAPFMAYYDARAHPGPLLLLVEHRVFAVLDCRPRDDPAGVWHECA